MKQESLDISSQNKTAHKAFYFKFEHKIEFVPHIEEEVKKFTKKYDSEIKKMNKEQCMMLVKAIQKKIVKIQEFYDEKYIDYRAHLILRSKKVLHDFLVRNSKILFPIEPEKDESSSIEKSERASITNKKQVKSKNSSVQRLSISKTDKTKIRSPKTPINSNTHSRKLKTQKSSQKISILSPNISRQKVKIQSFKNIQNSIEEEQEQTDKKIKKVGQKKVVSQVQPTKKMNKAEYIQYLKSKQK